jgi:hypothetical protein
VIWANAAIGLYTGILAGLHEDWMRMSLFLSGAVVAVFVGAATFVVIRLRDRLPRVEERLRINRRPIPKKAHWVTTSVGTFMVLSITAHMILSIVAGFREDWFRLGIHLAAYAITLIVCAAILAAMNINMYLARLEPLPADPRNVENA